MKFPVKKYNEGHFIFKEGSAGGDAYIVKTGRVEIFRVMKDKRITLSVINEGGILGEMALFLEENKRTASAMARTYTELVEISKSKLNDINKGLPDNHKRRFTVPCHEAEGNHIQRHDPHGGKAVHQHVHCPVASF